MSAFLDSIIGPKENLAPPSRGMDGSALPPPDREETLNWDNDLTKYSSPESDAGGSYNHEGTFTDSPSEGRITKTYDEIMEAEKLKISEASLNRHDDMVKTPVNTGRASKAAPANEEGGEPEELIEVGVEIVDMGVIPFQYADAMIDVRANT